MDVEFVTSRFNTHSAKYGQDKGEDPSYIYCGVADMDAAAPERVLEALKRRLEHGVMGYTELPGDYKDLVSDWMRQQYGCAVKAEWILFSPRINMALNMAVDTFTDLGDSIIVNTPAYPALTDAVVKWGRCLKESPLILRDGRYTLDLEGMERLVDERTRAFILCNPHNPTGRVWSVKELGEITAFCKRHDLFLLSDDIHGDFAWQGSAYTPILWLYHDPENEKVILYNSLTKTLNIPGIIFSNILIPNPELRAMLETTIDKWGLHNPNVFAADILRPAYTECGEWIGKMKDEIFKNIQYADAYIRERLPQLDVYIPDGTYLMWIGYRRTGWRREEMERRLKEKARLIPLMGEHFGKAGEGYFRLNMGTSREQAQKILQRLSLCFD